MDNAHNLLMLGLILDFHCVKLSLDVRNVVSLHLSSRLRVLNNDLFFMMCWGRLQLHWGLFSLYNCFNVFNNLRLLVLCNFIVHSLVISLVFLDL